MTGPGRESVWRVSCFCRPARRESSEQRRVGPSVPEWARNGPQRACDPRKRVREVVAACVGQCMTGKRAHDREAKSHGRPVGKPLRHPILGERPRDQIAGNRLCEPIRKEKLTLSGPRRAQAGSHLPTVSARDQRSGSARTGVLRVSRKSQLTRPTR